MINPHMLKPAAKRWNNPRFAGGKMYLAVLLPAGLRCRRVFKSASEAESYAARLFSVARRLYDQRIVDESVLTEEPAMSPSPAEPA